jgi:hypothetical protein
MGEGLLYSKSSEELIYYGGKVYSMTPVPVTRTLLYATQRLYDTLRYVKLYIVVYKFNNKTRAVHTIYKYHYI